VKLLSYGPDGGKHSTVSGFWLIEIKSLFSIVLLRFDKGSREAYHSHAFHALTWWLWGEVEEHHLDGTVKVWKPSLLPKLTLRSCFHKVFARKRTYAISFRGPWANRWQEYSSKGFTNLTHGRKEVP
jgi:hypothetical protein